MRSEPTLRHPAATSDHLGRILIVDDDAAILELLKASFADGRFEVITAQRGADALTLARARRPDAILLDIIMPGMDGVAVLREILAMDSSIPVVMLTGAGDDDLARHVTSMGAFDYLAKPFDVGVLYGIVVAAVSVGASRAWAPFGVHRASRGRARPA